MDDGARRQSRSPVAGGSLAVRQTAKRVLADARRGGHCRSHLPYLVPQFADYCVVDVIRGEGEIRANSGRARGCRQRAAPAGFGLHATRSPVPGRSGDDGAGGGPAYAGAPGHSGRPGCVRLRPADAQLLERLAPCSVIVVPLQASGHIHGALLLGRAECGRGYDVADLDLAAEIGHRVAMAIENVQLFDQAVQASRARDEMLAMVAHDLRNPLNTAKMGLSLLLETITTDAGRRNVELVNRAADRMNRLIEDLLDVTRVEGGKLRIEPQQHSAAALAREAIAMLTPLAEAGKITLTTSAEPELPPVMADTARMLQVFSNLIGNALKFTPAGGRISVTCKQGERPGRARHRARSVDRARYCRSARWQSVGRERGRRRVSALLHAARGESRTSRGRRGGDRSGSAGRGTAGFMSGHPASLIADS